MRVWIRNSALARAKAEDPGPNKFAVSELLMSRSSKGLLHPGFFPDPDRTFFPESGSGSAENPDLIRKNQDPDP